MSPAHEFLIYIPKHRLREFFDGLGATATVDGREITREQTASVHTQFPEAGGLVFGVSIENDAEATEFALRWSDRLFRLLSDEQVEAFYADLLKPFIPPQPALTNASVAAAQAKIAATNAEIAADNAKRAKRDALISRWVILVPAVVYAFVLNPGVTLIALALSGAAVAVGAIIAEARA